MTQWNYVALETLAWMRHADLAPLLNPVLCRWGDPDDSVEQMLERLEEATGPP